ncbi:hypothetical protein MMC07_000346 [Pseudocyphellaria aurata]|nr:hypothetical protein [Pseudocyphellaria aurata]
MVKADVRSDYYRDLECTPAADAVEIKKQYKKLALKLHPDRNPGKEQEFNAKFQTIQTAHDILVDPLQRSKYDSERLRAGLLHTYASPSPSRPNMPPRNATTNYPPPPSRAPPSASKSNFPPTPSGTNRYTNYPRAEPGSSWNSSAGAEDAKSKAEKFRAWEQLRHEQGPVPGRNMPPKATFDGSLPKRSDRFSDFYTDSPGISRSKTTRLPKKPGFASTATGGNEPQAPPSSAYANVSSRGERPSAPRATTHFPPPPSRAGATTFKKPDPVNASRGTFGPENLFAQSSRLSTPYATTGGEKTYLSSHGLGRSSSWRETRRESEWFDNESNNAEHVHPRATSARSNRKHSASPKMASQSHKPPSPALSSSSSSSSSSDESVQMGDEEIYSSTRRSRNPQRRRARNVPDVHRSSRFKPSVKIEDVEDEDRLHSGHVDGGYGSSGDSRKRHAADQSPRNPGSDYNPEGFMQHRMKRDVERQQRQAPQTSASKAYTPSNHTPPQRPLQRPRSWHDSSGSAEGVDGSRSHARAGAGDHHDKAPMYDPFGYNPSPSTPPSNKWSDQWPFNSPKKPRISTAAPPPYWAIPSSLAPAKQPESPREHLHKYSRSHLSSKPVALNSANTAVPNSFTFPESGAPNSFKPTPPLRSHSSETINLNFSPTEWDGKFTGSTNEYFVPPPSVRGNAARGRFSPTKNRSLRPNQPLPQQARTSNDQTAHNRSASKPPSPPNAVPPLPSQPASSISEEWAQHFKPATFFPPPPSGIPARAVSRKRAMAPKKFPNAAYQRQSKPNPASVSVAVDDAEEDSEVASVPESLSSKTSGGVSPMDIDPALTPPSTGRSQEHGETKSPSQPNPSEKTPRPPVPPRAKKIPPASEQDPHLNLGELKHVAPFAPSNDGLANLNGLASTLPFESRPSKQAVEHSPPQPLALPNPPKGPQVPVSLTQTSWERYIAQMSAYMFEWNTYNTMMVNHFSDRQARVEKTLQPGWMSAIGEGGFKTYMQGVEEDFRVRAHWDVSWEKHRECMKALGGVRERLLGSSISI